MAYFNERAERDTWKELKVNCIRTYILLKDSFQGKTINWLRAIYWYTTGYVTYIGIQCVNAAIIWFPIF